MVPILGDSFVVEAVWIVKHNCWALARQPICSAQTDALAWTSALAYLIFFLFGSPVWISMLYCCYTLGSWSYETYVTEVDDVVQATM